MSPWGRWRERTPLCARFGAGSTVPSLLRGARASPGRIPRPRRVCSSLDAGIEHPRGSGTSRGGRLMDPLTQTWIFHRPAGALQPERGREEAKETRSLVMGSRQGWVAAGVPYASLMCPCPLMVRLLCPVKGGEARAGDHRVQFGSLRYPGGEVDEPRTSPAFGALSRICLLRENTPCCSVSRSKAKDLRHSVLPPLSGMQYVT